MFLFTLALCLIPVAFVSASSFTTSNAWLNYLGMMVNTKVIRRATMLFHLLLGDTSSQETKGKSFPLQYANKNNLQIMQEEENFNMLREKLPILIVFLFHT
ncbi:MAG: hypothetical protein N2560_09965 [Ignavibacteria bacterium]|nr:hypothetical protein [Ignavibacteria bacterium]